MEPTTHRYHIQLWVGRQSLTLAVGLYIVALILPKITRTDQVS